ncbi:MAG: hypothetical protein QM811_11260 [Pirellulales bacterium]
MFDVIAARGEARCPSGARISCARVIDNGRLAALPEIASAVPRAEECRHAALRMR